MTVHAFVDETKRHGLLLAVAVVAPRDLADTRALMRSLCMPRQARIHFNHERDSRRSRIVTAINSTNVNVDIYDGAAIRDQRKARAACLHQVVLDLARVGGRRLIIEQDDSALQADTHVLFIARREAGADDFMTYDHLRAAAEPLLWIADAAAWCWTQPDWRRRIKPVVRNVWTA